SFVFCASLCATVASSASRAASGSSARATPADNITRTRAVRISASYPAYSRARAKKFRASVRIAANRDVHDEPEADQHGQKRRSAVADERQRHADDRQDARDHADVEEDVPEEQRRA